MLLKSRVLLVVACTSCKVKKEDPPSPLPVASDAARSVANDAVVAPIDAAPPPAPIDAGLPARASGTAPEVLVRDARAFVALAMPDVVLVEVVASYVRADGTLDPKYGELEIEFGASARPLEQLDDPSRPTGAPLPSPPPNAKPRENGCPKPAWIGGKWTLRDGYCRRQEPLVGPRCTAKVIWDRAIAQGAPKDAIAVLKIDSPNDFGSSALWRFEISDRLRKIQFRKSYKDDCPVAIEQGSAEP